MAVEIGEINTISNESNSSFLSYSQIVVIIFSPLEGINNILSIY